MGFRKALFWAGERLLLFTSGAGLVLALQGHLYACALVMLLLGLWLAPEAAWGRRRESHERIVEPATTPSGAEVQSRLADSLFDQIPAPLVLLEPSGVLRAANRAARTLFRTDDRVLSPPQPLLDALQMTSLGGRLTLHLQIELEPKTYALSIIDLAGPAAPGRIAMLLDIQPEVRVAEAAALRELMQVLSHEIMNALTPVASLAATASDLLSDQTPASNAMARDAVETLARRAQGLGRFVEAYRRLARLPAPVLRPVSIGALFGEAAQLFESQWPRDVVRLTVVKPDPDIVAELDRDLMVHALMNILSNGADAATACKERPTTIRLLAEAHSTGVILRIADNGPGVPTGDRERIFQPFFTTKAEGTGVGLSFARQVILSHGGVITLADERSESGAVFEVKL